MAGRPAAGRPPDDWPRKVEKWRTFLVFVLTQEPILPCMQCVDELALNGLIEEIYKEIDETPVSDDKVSKLLIQLCRHFDLVGPRSVDCTSESNCLWIIDRVS